MKKVNFFKLSQWIIFTPIIIPISLLTGAYEGLKKVYDQANLEIFEAEEVNS